MAAKRRKPHPIEALLETVTQRTEPRCRHFGTCGGCDLQHLPYEAQPPLKQRLIETALAAEGVEAEVAPTVPASDPWRYRNKIEATFDTRDGELVLGFGPKGRWYERFDLLECPIAPDWMVQAVEIARRWARGEGVPAYDQRRREGFLRYLVLREGRTTDYRIINLVTNAGHWDLYRFKDALEEVDFSGVLRTLHTGLGAAVRFERVEVLSGRPEFSERVAGLNLTLSLDSFFQTNTLMAERMYEYVRELAREGPHASPHPSPPRQRGEGAARVGRVLDLYCGVGSIGLLLAPEAESVTGVEEVEPAVERARANAALNRAANTEFICARAEKFAVEAGRYDLAVLDPPRAGCSKRVLRHLAEAGVPRMIYVSCSPQALARDLAYLGEHYAIGRVQPFDLFPQTRHVEAVVEATRR